jgi:glycosyltransferase involved in cell wall biosynthesis
MMHILFYSESPVYGGAEEYVYLIASSLADSGFRFTFLHDENSDLGEFTERIEAAGVRVEKIPRINGKLDLVNFAAHIRHFKRLSPDVVHFNQSNPYSQQYTVLAARAAGVKNLIATYHLTPRARTATLRGRILEKVVTGLFKCIVVQSEGNRGEMTANFSVADEKVKVLANGIVDPGVCTLNEIEELRRELNITKGKHVISCAGRLTAQKGIEDLIDAVVLLDRNDLVIVISGDGPLAPVLRAKVRDYSLDSMFRFAGFRDDVWKIFRMSELVVIPSIYEGLPLVLLEAMAAGKPTVASRVYGLADTVMDGETGILVEPGSPGQIADAVAKLIDEPEVRINMGSKARELFEERYTVNEFSNSMLELYRETTTRENVN